VEGALAVYLEEWSVISDSSNGKKTLEYGSPELTALMPAINAIQSSPKDGIYAETPSLYNEVTAGYEDWE
jgi:hypothetical protein